VEINSNLKKCADATRKAGLSKEACTQFKFIPWKSILTLKSVQMQPGKPV